MSYYVRILGSLKCNNLAKAKQILEEKGLIEHVEILEGGLECTCPLCGNRHKVDGEINFDTEINRFDPEDVRGLAEVCRGELFCQGEDPEAFTGRD